MVKNNLQKDFEDAFDEFASKRIEAVEGALMEDKSSDYNRYRYQADTLFQEIRSRLDKSDTKLILDYEATHNAMWFDVVRASYIQGLKDSMKLNGITAKALCKGEREERA
jgi:hypothetical protein